ncbi:MIP/aquaporin family protein [Salibacterium qingdaonense]|uniref:Glycerol uptake facilitator protein n=1 Tax=Salibacterium qingdaonense TaxID=266892 RepID=A0A1I4HZB4_9BACI|nr:MIP/aquaporin family protein [Salibacterium qingdaonense]SFL47479.1 glycerol uptake facilitator protein [Salibacterium qingdaonense]
MSPFLGELLGTMILVILGCGVVAGVTLRGSKSEGADWIVVSIGWGLGVAMGVYAVGSFTGAHINPAVTIGFAAAGTFPWADVPVYIAGQMVGAVLGACVVYFHYLAHWSKTEDKGAKLGVFATDPAIRNYPANLVSEIIGTFILVLGLQFIGANEFTEGLNPLITGLLIAAIGISLGGPTGYAINPARDLGPRIAHAFLPIPGKGPSDWAYAWIPIVGPIIGGVYGGVFHQAFFVGNVTPVFWIFTVIVAAALVHAFMNDVQGTKQTMQPGQNHQA